MQYSWCLWRSSPVSVGGPEFCVWETVCLGELLVWFSVLGGASLCYQFVREGEELQRWQVVGAIHLPAVLQRGLL